MLPASPAGQSPTQRPCPHPPPPLHSLVWLNEYSSQFLPIVGLLGLRMVVGVGEWVLKKMGREKKSEQEQLAEELGRHRAKEFNAPADGKK